MAGSCATKFRIQSISCFAKEFGRWRAVIADVVEKYLDCGILKNGFARVRCPECKSEYLLAFSCKRRGFCPSCCAKRSVLFGEFLREKVLSGSPHRHVVFSIPRMFRIFFLYDRKLLTQLCRCAWLAIRQYFEACLPEGSLPAAVLSIQTAGDMLNWNPHIHGLVASGVFRADGSFVPATLMQESLLRELFEAHVFRLLAHKGLIGPELIAKIRAWRHTGFHVWAGPAIYDKQDAVRVGLYIVRAPGSATRLQLTREGLLSYLSKGFLPQADSDPLFEPNGRIFDPLEWIARLTSHIPDKRAQTVHYYGAYSNAHRGKTAKRSAAQTAPAPASHKDSEPVWLKSRRKSWAALIQLVYESDPLLCPRCRRQMQIVSFIRHGKVIDKILAHIGWKFDLLPLPSRPPPDPSPECDSFSAD
jgi:Transposase zinc-binding domain/Putative transposase